MTTDPVLHAIETGAKASYEAYFDGLIGCCEEPWARLPQEHRERLIDAHRVGVNAYEAEIALVGLVELGRDMDKHRR